jgi:hypothetical protein
MLNSIKLSEYRAISSTMVDLISVLLIVVIILKPEGAMVI